MSCFTNKIDILNWKTLNADDMQARIFNGFVGKFVVYFPKL